MGRQNGSLPDGAASPEPSEAMKRAQRENLAKGRGREMTERQKEALARGREKRRRLLAGETYKPKESSLTIAEWKWPGWTPALERMAVLVAQETTPERAGQVAGVDENDAVPASRHPKFRHYVQRLKRQNRQKIEDTRTARTMHACGMALIRLIEATEGGLPKEAERWAKIFVAMRQQERLDLGKPTVIASHDESETPVAQVIAQAKDSQARGELIAVATQILRMGAEKPAMAGTGDGGGEGGTWKPPDASLESAAMFEVTPPEAADGELDEVR